MLPTNADHDRVPTLTAPPSTDSPSTDSSSTGRPSTGRPSRAAALGLAAAALTAVAALGGCEPEAEGLSDLRLVYSATLNGYIEPCGCTMGKTGGIDRIAAAVRTHTAGHPGALFVDGGDLFAEALEVEEKLGRQLELKADEIFSVWADIGCEAMALGDFDLALGVDVLRDLSARHGIPILCANLFDADGDRPFEASVIVERNGLKIGIFGLLGGRLDEAYAKDGEAQRYNVAARAKELGYDLRSWKTVVDKLVADLAPRTDVLLCASHLGFDANIELARLHPELDLVFGGHTDNRDYPYEIIDGTPVTSAEVKGSRINRVDLWFDDAYRASEGRGSFADVSEWIATEIAAETTARGIVMLAGRRASLGEAEWLSRRNGVHDTNGAAVRRLDELGAMPPGARMSYATIPLPMSAHRDELALAAIADYHERQHDMWMAEPVASRHPTPRFVGPQACYECHVDQYEFWRSTQHSRAFATLEATAQHTDVECIGCHTVGWEQPRGFDHPSASAGFENVQCASCHGAGGPHVGGGLRYFEAGRLLETPQQTCMKCHDEDHDPRFKSEAAARYMAVTCPPMPPAGRGQPALLATYREGAELLAAEERPDWGEISRLWLLAGDSARALAAARSWVEAEPRSIPVRVNLAERLVLDGEHAEAVETCDWILNRQPSHGRAWTAKGAALLGLGRYEEAVVAGREAYSLDPSDWANARVLAESLAGTSDRMGAVDVLRAHIERVPEHEPYLGPLLRDLLGAG